MRKLTLLALAVAAAVALFASCAKQAPKTVTVYMWSEYIDPELLERFEKETGQKVVLDTYENTETMMSKIASASDLYDVVVVSDHAVRTLSGKGTFRRLDLKKIPNAKNVMERFRKPAYEIIREAVADYGYPVLFGFPAGHGRPNMSLILGREITLTVQQNECRITF